MLLMLRLASMRSETAAATPAETGSSTNFAVGHLRKSGSGSARSDLKHSRERERDYNARKPFANDNQRLSFVFLCCSEEEQVMINHDLYMY